MPHEILKIGVDDLDFDLTVASIGIKAETGSAVKGRQGWQKKKQG